MTTRLMIIDPFADYRDALRAAFELHNGDKTLTIVGELSDVEAAIPLLHKLKPDIILLHIPSAITPMGKIIKDLLIQFPTIKIIGMLTYYNHAAAITMLAMKMRALVSKGVHPLQLIRIIHDVKNGWIWQYDNSEKVASVFKGRDTY